MMARRGTGRALESPSRRAVLAAAAVAIAALALARLWAMSQEARLAKLSAEWDALDAALREEARASGVAAAKRTAPLIAARARQEAEAARQAAGVPSLEATALAPQLPRSPPPLQAQALAQAQAQAQASSSSTPPVLAVRAGHADGDIEATAQPVVAEAKQGASSDGQQQQQQQQHSPAPEVATPLLRASCRGLQVSFDPASGRGGLAVGEEGFEVQIPLLPPVVDGKAVREWAAADQAGAVHAVGGAEVQLTLERVSDAAVALELRSTLHEGASQRSFELFIADGHSFYGGGERFNAVDQRGIRLPMSSTDEPGNKQTATYKPVPFMLSGAGYGIWVDSFAQGVFDLMSGPHIEHALDVRSIGAHQRAGALDSGRRLAARASRLDEERARVQASALNGRSSGRRAANGGVQGLSLKYSEQVLRVVFCGGPSLLDAVGEFTRLTGRPQVPPAWALAPWKGRDAHKTSEEVLEDAVSLRRHGIPGSVILIDSPWETAYNDFTVNEVQFSEPEKMFLRVKQLGFYVALWLTPFINRQNKADAPGIHEWASPNFGEAQAANHLVNGAGGRPQLVSWWKGQGARVDFTSTAAREWWKGQLNKTRHWGNGVVRAFKSDDGEGGWFQAGASFSDGSPLWKMRNRYSVEYLATMREYVETTLRGDGCLLARSAFTGSSLSYVWAGDNEASFSPRNGLPTVLRAGQSAAASGIFLWGHDVGGYTGTASKELFMRWTQFGALSPLMHQFSMSNLGPWDYGEDGLTTYRTYARLHMSLFPYRYALCHEAALKGYPLLRPMALAFQSDARAADYTEQYALGDRLLVAPVVTQAATSKTAWLPADTEWINFWTGEVLGGGPDGSEISLDAPVQTLPLLVAAGTVMEMLPEDVDTLVPLGLGSDSMVKGVGARRVLEVWPVGDDGRRLRLEPRGWEEGISAVPATPGEDFNLFVTLPKAAEVEVRFLFTHISKATAASAATAGADAPLKCREWVGAMGRTGTVCQLETWVGELRLKWSVASDEK